MKYTASIISTKCLFSIFFILLLTGCRTERCDQQFVLSDQLPDGKINESYSIELQAACPKQGTQRWYLKGGTLPPGLAVVNPGKIIGISVQRGVFSFIVAMEVKTTSIDASGNQYNVSNQYTKSFSVKIN